MLKSITIGNDLELFYTNLNKVISEMFPTLNLYINRISETIHYIYIQNSSNQMILDMYALCLLPEDNNIENAQVVLCNNLTINSGNIDFTSITNSNIGPCFYTYDSNNNQTVHTYWINNTLSNSLNINTGDTNLDSIYKLLYTFSFNEIIFPTNDYNEIQYIWFGFKSYQESGAMTYITKTNKNNIGMFGITSSMPTTTTTNAKFLTTFSNTPQIYNINNFSMNSSIICLSNIILPQSINAEYFPYLYFCIGKDISANNYIQLENDGIEYYKLFNGIMAITSNPKFTLYQQIIYTINIFNTNYYTLNSFRLIDNQGTVTVNWGDGSDNSIITPLDSVQLTHNYNLGGNYTITISYSSLTNPNLLSNIAITDDYITEIDLDGAKQLTGLNISNMFKSTNEIFGSILESVVLPPNITTMNVDGFCENCTKLDTITLPTQTCTMTGQWLYNSAFDLGDAAIFTYPANITFVKNTNNAINNFYTGNFSEHIVIDSDITCDSLIVGDNVTTLEVKGDIDCNKITSDMNADEEYICALTTLQIKNNCNLNNTEISNLPNLTALSIYDDSATTVLYNLNHLDSLSTLNVSDNLTTINNITYCNSLQSLGIPENITTIGNSVGDYCNSFTSFVVDNDNQNYSSVNGVLYNKAGTTLLKIPYGYTNVDTYELPLSVTSIGANSMFTQDPLSLIVFNSSILNINNAFATNGHITTLIIDCDVLSNSEFTECTIDNLSLSANVTSIGTGAFSNVAITSLTIYNDSLVLSADQFDLTSLVQIKGYVGSTAETFANDNNITFIPIATGVTEYTIVIPSNNYIVSNICTMSDSYTHIDWGDSTDPSNFYNFETTVTHTYENSGTYTVTMTHYAANTFNFNYTNINNGLFALASTIDYSGLTDCSSIITNLFSNLSNVSTIIYPPNIIEIDETLTNSSSISSIILPSALKQLSNSFNANYNNLSSISLPTGMNNITNCFNNTNVIGTTLSLETTDTTNGLTILNSFNSCSSITSINIGQYVISITNCFMNLLNVTTLTCSNDNSVYSASNNMLLDKTETTLCTIPGGLSSFTIPNSVTTLAQSSIANNKTYSAITIPETVTTINYPFYNPLDLTQGTTITTLTILNPYTLISSINKVNSITESDVTTYYDTAIITNIAGYEHSKAQSQSDGYDRYPNCSSYNFSSSTYGYYNSSIVIGSNYTDVTFTNSDLLTISDNLISGFNNHFNYIVPDSDVMETYNGLITEITTNYYDFITNNDPFVIFYYVDGSNRYYYRIYILTSNYSNTSISIDDNSSTYDCRLITCTYSIPTAFENIVDEGSFSVKSITTSDVDTYAVLNYKYLTILKNSINITPTFLKYSTFILNVNTGGGGTSTSDEYFHNYITDGFPSGMNPLVIDETFFPEYLNRSPYYIVIVSPGSLDHPVIIYYETNTIQTFTVSSGRIYYGTYYTFPSSRLCNANLVWDSTTNSYHCTGGNNEFVDSTNYWSSIYVVDATIPFTYNGQTYYPTSYKGYVIGSNNTGTNKLLLSDSTVRADDYWLNAEVDEINADNIVHICSYEIDGSGNIGTLLDDTDTSMEEVLADTKLIRTDKYIFENNVELVSPIYELPNS